MKNTFGFHYHGYISSDEHDKIYNDECKRINKILRRNRILTYVSWVCIGIVTVFGLILIFK